MEWVRAWHAARNWKRIGVRALLGTIVCLIAVACMYSHFFGPADSHAEMADFVVEPDTSIPQLASTLRQQGYVKSTWALRIALLEEAHGRGVRPGGYKISKNMDAWRMGDVFADAPATAFVTIPDSSRKEQVGSILAAALNWSDAQKEEWNDVSISTDPTLADGEYAPGVYLIPSDQPPAQIAQRMHDRFTDDFAPYMQEAYEKGLDWPKVLTLASIVDRESSKVDRSLVAGILLNRLDIGMKLQADATLQYVKGKTGSWWPVVTGQDKYDESPFNTYQNEGLPPHPIDTPSAAAVAAVLDPEKTDCVYYLHDAKHQIHCSLTYAGQVKNVNKYLR